jgi:hypothetical protein
MMQKDGLITRAERVGIHTTSKGSAMLVALMHERYEDEAESLLGRPIFEELRRRVNQS